MKRLKITKGYSETVSQRKGADNPMTKSKGTKGQTMIYKTTHRKHVVLLLISKSTQVCSILNKKCMNCCYGGIKAKS